MHCAPSACLITFVYWKRLSISSNFSPSRGTTIPVFVYEILWRNSDESPLMRRSNTSGSAVAQMPRHALCPSVVSFNSVIPQAQSFIIVTSASDLPLRSIKYCSVVFGVTLRHHHKHFAVISCQKQSRRLPATSVINLQLCVLHLTVEPFTARDGPKYLLRIAEFAYGKK